MNPNNWPTAEQLVADLIKQAQHYGCYTETFPIKHKTGEWQQLRIADLRPENPSGIFLLTAGMHGTEIAGPLTIQQRFGEILACIRTAGFRLVCYPLMNPSGWDNGTVRNIDKDGGSHKAGNNDFLRYQFDWGWTWKFSSDYPSRKWRWSSDPIVGERQPAETLVMHKLLQQENWPNVKVVLDMHQDYFTPNLPAGFYQYPFGDLSQYNSIINKARTLVPVLANREFCFDRENPNDVVHSDENGCIVFHDGTLADLAYNLDVPHALTIETSGATELQMAMEVNMTWIRGLCDLASKQK